MIGIPRGWCSEPLIEWTPERLPGYAEAVAAIARGESPFPPRTKAEPRTRQSRSRESLQEERDRLVTERSGRFETDTTGDTAAARLNISGMRRHYKNYDQRLQAYTRLTERIDRLDARISKLAP